MAGVKGKSGGPRANSGGARAGAGRPRKPPRLLTDTPIHLDPADFLMDLMNNASIDLDLRVTAAKVLMPFTHERAGEVGKKEQQQAEAKKAAVGRYAPSPPPLRVVK